PDPADSQRLMHHSSSESCAEFEILADSADLELRPLSRNSQTPFVGMRIRRAPHSARKSSPAKRALSRSWLSGDSNATELKAEMSSISAPGTTSDSKLSRMQVTKEVASGPTSKPAAGSQSGCLLMASASRRKSALALVG